MTSVWTFTFNHSIIFMSFHDAEQTYIDFFVISVIFYYDITGKCFNESSRQMASENKLDCWEDGELQSSPSVIELHYIQFDTRYSKSQTIVTWNRSPHSRLDGDDDDHIDRRELLFSQITFNDIYEYSYFILSPKGYGLINQW